MSYPIINAHISIKNCTVEVTEGVLSVPSFSGVLAVAENYAGHFYDAYFLYNCSNGTDFEV